MTKNQDASNNSATETIDRFATKSAAEKYNRALVGTKKHIREGAALDKALNHVPNGSTVLDFPCGTGRLHEQLNARNYRIFAVDSSWHMADTARNNIENQGGSANFGVSDVLHSAFSDDSFDAVVCNRLFHHFFESETRVRALKELNRISRNQVVVSYYGDKCLDAFTFRLKNALRRRSPTDRVPIPPDLFAREVRQAGMRIVEEIHARPMISMQTYAVLTAVGH